MLHHPDRSKDGEGEKFKAVSAAYETICKHVKGQDEVDLDDPDFQILFELFHLFNFIGSQREEALNLEEQSQGYASGGSSCEGDDDDIEDDVDDRTISDIEYASVPSFISAVGPG